MPSTTQTMTSSSQTMTSPTQTMTSPTVTKSGSSAQTPQVTVCQDSDVTVVPGNTVTMTSENYPNSYASSSDCWLVVTTIPGFLVQLHFDQFSTESCCDVLYIYDSDEKRVNARKFIDQMKGQQSNVTKYSRSNKIAIRFRSDGSFQYSGFNATISAVPSNGTSELETTTESVSTTKPSGGGLKCWLLQKVQAMGREVVNERRKIDCFEGSCLLLTANATMPFGPLGEVSSQVTMGMCVPTSTCQLGGCSSISTLGVAASLGLNITHCAASCCNTRLCNDVTTEAMTSTTQTMTSPMTITGPEEVTASFCSDYDVTITPGSPVVITSPNYPNNYVNSQNCWMVLTAPSQYKIQVNFTSFQTESCCDGVRLYNSNRTEDSELLIDELKGSVGRSQALQLSSSNYISLIFFSDSSLTDEGFTATVTAVSKETEQPTGVSPTSDSVSTRREDVCGFNTDVSFYPRTFTTPGYPTGYPSNRRCSWTLRAFRGYQVELTVYAGNTESCCDYMEIFDSHLSTIAPLARIQGLITRNRTYTSTSRHLTVTFISDPYVTNPGYAASFVLVPDTRSTEPTTTATTRSCDARLAATSETKFLESPNYPSPYNANSLCMVYLQAPEGTHIVIQVQEFITETCCDKLIFYDDGRQTATWAGSVARGTLYQSKTPTVTLRFTSDLGIQYRGFRISYTAVDDNSTSPSPTFLSCNSTTQASLSPQTIASPGWPGDYPSRQDCRWNIVGQDGFAIQFNFTQFNTEACCDYLEISSSGSQLNRFAGNTDNTIEQYDVTNLQLLFHSDGSLEKSGFYGSFKLVPLVTTTTASETTSPQLHAFMECGNHAEASLTTKFFASPRWPYNYPANQDCSWTIGGRQSYFVRFNFQEFTTETCCDYLRISVDGTEVHKLFGTLSDQTFEVDATSIDILFHSDRSVQRSGFRGTFELVAKEEKPIPPTSATTQVVGIGNLTCGFVGRIENDPVGIASPNYPQNYPKDTFCTWTLIAPADHEIEFSLEEMDIEVCCDYVELFDGEDRRLITKLQSMSGDEMKFRTTTGMLVVNFTSDSTVTRPGFLASAYSVPAGNLSRNSCGFTSEATSSWQQLYSPMFPENYPSRAKCQWLIISPEPGSTIQIEITEISVETCCDTLQIFDGRHESSPLLHSPTQTPMNLTSSGNGVKLMFTSDNTLTKRGFAIRYKKIAPVSTTARTTRETTTQSTTVTVISTRSTTTASQPDNKCPNNDVPFLPGCTFREYYDKTWICSTLFLNDFPYGDINECRTNMNYYNHCVKESLLICSTGTKQTISFGLGTMGVAAEMMTQSIMNMTNVMSPTYDAFCSSDSRFLDELIENLTMSTSLGDASALPQNICNLTKLTQGLQQMMNFLPSVIRAKTDVEFCRSYKSMVDSMAQMYEGLCDFSYFARFSQPLGKFYNNIQKILDLTPELMRKSSDLPKCLALASIERSPVIPTISPTSFNTTDAQGCSSYNMDLMFLMDGSASISSPNFVIMIDFVKSVVGTIDLKNNKVGVIQYSHYQSSRPSNQQRYITTEISLGQFSSYSRFNAAMNQIQHHGYTTYTAAAIRKAIQVDLKSSDRFDSPCTKKIIVVITDGSASDPDMLQPIITAAKEIGVTFFAVGVGNARLSEIEIISGGVSDHTYFVQDFQSLKAQVPMIRDALHNLLSDEFGSGSAP
uniref:Cubilin-like n=1 Tax=Phallusia mammillata TaxID=59560 RepID=A0A6F9DAU1_9ASCI|nr:cubilin-like [Phallusia mammillata]